MRAFVASAGRFLVVAAVTGGLLAWSVTADRAARAHAAASLPGGWEYRQETSVPATDAELLDEEVLRDQQRMLEANGRDGWELASTHVSDRRRAGSGTGHGGLRRGVRVQATAPLIGRPAGFAA